MPKYRRHSSRDKGYAERRGKRRYFPGPYGSPQSLAAYQRFVDGRADPLPQPAVGSVVTIGDLVIRFLSWAKQHFGTGRTRYGVYKTATTHLLAAFAAEQADKFGPRKLKQLQQRLIEAGDKRTYINYTVNCVRYAFKWAASEELIPASVHASLMTVSGLRAGHTQAQESTKRKHVKWEEVAAVLPFLSRNVAAMVQVQWYTGCRSGSLCQARPEQFNQEAWEWRPRHKTEYRAEVIIPIGPRCRKIIEPFVKAAKAGGFVFSPRSIRKHPRYNHRYTTFGYRVAIVRAIDKANEKRADNYKLTHWTPHDLRHARAQLVRDDYGIEAAQAVLAHESLSATQIYSQRRLALARRVAAETG